jgi:hypothetical protein
MEQTLKEEIQYQSGILKNTVYIYEEILIEGEISFFKLSKKINSYIRRANGAGERIQNSGAVHKFDKFVDFMEKMRDKAEALETKYKNSNSPESKEEMKKDYKKLKIEAKKQLKLLKDSTNRWLWAVTDDPRVSKTFKVIVIGFFALFGITILGGIAANGLN